MYNVRPQTKPRAPRGQTWTKETQGVKTRWRQIQTPNQKTDSRGAEAQACGDIVSIFCIMLLKRVFIIWTSGVLCYHKRCSFVLCVFYDFLFIFPFSYENPPPGFIKVCTWLEVLSLNSLLQYVIRECVNALEISFQVSILQYMQDCFCRKRMTNQKTVFLMPLVMRTPGTFWLMLLPKDCGCLWGKRWRSCSVSKRSDAFTSL